MHVPKEYDMRITILTTQQHPLRQTHSRRTVLYRILKYLYHKTRLENGCMSVHPCVKQHIAVTSSYKMYGNVVMRTRHDNNAVIVSA